MELVLGELKGVLSDSISKFLKENVRFEETDIKTIFDESMDKVLYHDEGFIKELSSKMSDVIMPAYMKELRYLKKVVSGVDKMTLSMKKLQERLAEELKTIVPNPQNHDDTLKRVNDVIAKFVDSATKIVENEIGLREVVPEDKEIEGAHLTEGEKANTTVNEVKVPIPLNPQSIANEFSKNIFNIIKKTGGSPPVHQSSNTVGAPKMHQSPPVHQTQVAFASNTVGEPQVITGGSRIPNVDPQINQYMQEKHQPIKIPKGKNYIDYDGPLSKQINDILIQKIARKREEEAKNMENIQKSDSYKNATSSLNNLFIDKPNIPAQSINNLLQTIKDANISDTELTKILDQAAKQIDASKKGGNKKTRKRRYTDRKEK